MKLYETCSLAVSWSNPEPPEAKHTPVASSSLGRFGSRNAGNADLTPKPSPAEDNYKQQN